MVEDFACLILFEKLFKKRDLVANRSVRHIQKFNHHSRSVVNSEYYVTASLQLLCALLISEKTRNILSGMASTQNTICNNLNH